MGNPFSRPRRNSRNSSFDSISNAPSHSEAAVGVPVTVADVVPPPPTINPVATSQAPPAPQVMLSISSEKAAVAYGTEQTLLAMLSLKAPPAADDVKRPPMDLVACIDRSGSMRGEKIKLMKTTLDLLVRRTGLTSEDRLSLVTFDSSVKLDLGLEPMSTAGRAKAEGIIKGLHPGATTNLSGGALKAIDVLDASASRSSRTPNGDKADEAKRTRAVMLFTDGLANEGIRDTTQLVAAVNGALTAASARVQGPISLFTFGFGADHNEDCLRSLAAASGATGLYYYVENAETIPTAFADCLGGLTSVVAQNATLSFSPAPGVSVSRVLGSTYSRDAEGAVVLGDLFAEDEKDVLVELALPRLPAPSDAGAPVLTASLRAFNIARSAPDTVEATLMLARPEATPADQPVNAALDAQRNRIETAEAMEAASRMADAGDIAGGRNVLLAMKRKVAESSSAQEALSANLMCEIDSIETEYQSTARYRSVGSKMSKMQARSHGVQRATHANVGTYSGGGERKAALKASWLSSIKATVAGGDGSDSD